jgi:hypothetical protein
MSPPRKQRNRMNPLLLILVLGVGGVGAYGTLYARGDVESKLLDDLLGRKREVQAAETLPVLIARRAILPGAAVSRADVWDPAKGNFHFAPIPKDQVRANQAGANPWILRWDELEGRVLARPKDPMKAFTESDFLPKGTRPGPQSLVPEGKRYITVQDTAVLGLGDLAFNDRFDLVAVRPVPEKDIKAAREALAIVGDGRVAEQLRFQIQSGAVVIETPLAVNGRVIKPAAYSVEAGRGKGREVGLALDPEEASTLRGAVTRGETIYCMPRSNRAGAEEQMVPTGPSLQEQFDWLLSQVHRVTVVEGDKRRVLSIDRGSSATD